MEKQDEALKGVLGSYDHKSNGNSTNNDDVTYDDDKVSQQQIEHNEHNSSTLVEALPTSAATTSSCNASLTHEDATTTRPVLGREKQLALKVNTAATAGPSKPHMPHRRRWDSKIVLVQHPRKPPQQHLRRIRRRSVRFAMKEDIKELILVLGRKNC